MSYNRYKDVLPIIYRCGLVLLHLNIQELGYALMQPRIWQLPDPFIDDIPYLSIPIKNVHFSLQTVNINLQCLLYPHEFFII